MLRFESRRSLQKTEAASNKMPCKSAKRLLAAYRPVPVLEPYSPFAYACNTRTQPLWCMYI